MLSGYLVCWKELLMSRQIMQIAHLLFVFSEGCQVGIHAKNMSVFVWWLYLQWQAAPAAGGTTSFPNVCVLLWETCLACLTKVSCGPISGSKGKTGIYCELRLWGFYLCNISNTNLWCRLCEWTKQERVSLFCVSIVYWKRILLSLCNTLHTFMLS